MWSINRFGIGIFSLERKQASRRDGVTVRASVGGPACPPSPPPPSSSGHQQIERDKTAPMRHAAFPCGEVLHDTCDYLAYRHTNSVRELMKDLIIKMVYVPKNDMHKI